MADWLQPTFILFPFAAWMFLGIGLPWALALLPRDLWRERVTVLTVGMALGPLGLTVWMLMIGTWGRITLGGTLAGSAALAVLGSALAVWRFGRSRSSAGELRPTPTANSIPGARLARGERGLIAGIALIWLTTTVATAYWPFIAYDTQWVYGYNARIFLLEERIPDTLGYYPQLIPLSYTYLQQAWHLFDDVQFNDHAARVAIPWFNLTLLLMAYQLGWRAFQSRRIGLLTAALWACYPHAAAWAVSGDLEAPLTLYTTGFAAFFIAAWRTDRTDLALLSGLLLGGALWTKPTGGALAFGVMLAVAGWAVIVRFDRGQFWVKFKLAAVAGLASAPLGSLWYLRNLALGHTPVVFPPSYWHGFAQRSGQELGWLVLLALLVAGVLLTRPRRVDRWRWVPLLAIGLLLAGTLPTALNFAKITDQYDVWLWIRGDWSAARRLNAPEVGLIGIGFALLIWRAYPVWREWTPARRRTIVLIWALLLPYGCVWFFDFSYHYRLSFAVVPLMLVQIAVLIDGWLWNWLTVRRGGWVVATLSLSAAVAVAFYAASEHTLDAVRQGLETDQEKYDSGNPAVMVVVHALERYAAEHGDPVVLIPGEDRLPFFFPTWDIRNSRDPDTLPQRFEDLADIDIYVPNSVERFLADLAGKSTNSLQADVAVATRYYELAEFEGYGPLWPRILEPIPLGRYGNVIFDDGNFYYGMFTPNPTARYTPFDPGGIPDGKVLIGDFAQYMGHDVGNLEWTAGQRVFLVLYWQPTTAAPASLRYSIYLHLLSPDGDLITQWDSEPVLGLYPTIFWRPGESIFDFWQLTIPTDIEPGPAHLKMGLYDSLTGERLPVTLDGEIIGDGVIINDRLVVKLPPDAAN